MGWFHSVEFYVIAATVAAAVIALSALPQRRGEARRYKIDGDLLPGTDGPARLEVRVDDSRRLVVARTGLPTDTIAAELVVEVIGFDVKIEERLTAGRDRPAEPATALYTLDFFCAERYHISFDSPATGTFAAFTLPMREGISLSRELK